MKNRYRTQLTPEVFIRTNSKRMYDYALTHAALIAQKNVEYFMTIYNTPMLDNIYACEKYANSDVYVISDDDIIPAHDDTVFKMCDMLKQHPDIGMLGIAWRPALSPSEFAGWVKDEINLKLWEVDHVGGIFAIRKGIIEPVEAKPDFLLGIGDDKIISQEIRRKGFKVALWLDEWFCHIGEGKTTVWGQQP